MQPAQRPTGTVTFLVTEEVGSAPQAEMARHDSLLRRVLEEHGGYVYRAQRSGMSTAFATADAALAAAIEAQRALRPLRIRMALTPVPAGIDK